MKKQMIASGLVVSLLGGGTIAANAALSPSRQADKDGLKQVKWANDAKLTFIDAEHAALKKVDGKVLEIDLDRNGQETVYDVVVYDGSTIKEVTLNADSGKIVNAAKDDDAVKKVKNLASTKDVSEGQDDEYGYNQDRWANQSNITSIEAQQAALNEVQGKVLEMDLDKNDGAIVYDIVIYDGSTIKEVSVNADTGKVVKVAEDDDAKQKLEHLK